MNAIKFDNVTLGYDSQAVVHELSTALEPGSLTALVGPNGGGKSTLMKAIVGELRPRTGTITTPARSKIAYMPQLADVDRSFPISVFEVVAMGLWKNTGAFGGFGTKERQAVERALEVVGLSGFGQRSVDALSGGQMQRVLFARLTLQDAGVILLDEPFAAVDRRTMKDLIALIRSWHGEGRTILAVLHDFDAVHDNFPDAILLAREMIAHGPSSEALCPECLVKARAVSEAFDENAPARREAA